MSRPHFSARSLAAVIGLVAVGAPATGCGEETVDSAQMEQDLVGQLARDAGVDPAEVSVECPTDQKAEGGQRVRVHPEVTITDGGDGYEAVVPPQQL